MWLMVWASMTEPSDSYISKIHYRRGKRSVAVLLDMIVGSSPPPYTLLPAFKYQSSSELSSVAVHSSTSSIFAEAQA